MNSPMLRRIVLCVVAGTFPAAAQNIVPNSPKLTTGSVSPTLPSNAISHVTANRMDLWIGTGKGLARTATGGATWESFAGDPAFARPSIFSIATKGDTIWAATGYNKDVDGNSVQTGTGYAYSLNNGASWNSRPQPMDAQTDTVVQYGINSVRFLPIVVPEQNVTFDAAITDSAVWVASWSSGLRRSTDMGATWQRTVLPNRTMNSISPTDSLGYYNMDPRNDNNYLMFAVYAQDASTIWAGSAGGVNKSTDGGVSWTKFSFENQLEHILANWVIAIGGQKRAGGMRIWTTNWPSDIQGEQYGVSYTDDGGRIWKNVLLGVKAYGFAFKDSIVYVASENGLYRSADGGESWIHAGSIIDQQTGNQITSNLFYAVDVIGDTVYGGTADGLVTTMDNAAHPFGESWHVARSYQPVPPGSASYAYPNPFSPRTEVTRIHYNAGTGGNSITVELFDFGMNRFKTVIKDVQRTAGEHDEIWDGRDETGSTVANGVYFYRVTYGSGDPSWGKIMVIQ